MSNMNSPGSGSSASPSPTLPPWGEGSSLERSRYFARQLLTADDLTADQQHVLAKLRRHNRFLHGWGVVCGAGVRAAPNQKFTVVVEPGYLLGPQGDEILIDQCVLVDLSRQGLDGNAASPCLPPADPWLASTRADLRIGQRLYIAAAHAEQLSRPVRAQPSGCGCDDAACEYSRIRDDYVIRVLSSLPDAYAQMPPPVKPWLCPKGGVRDCPPRADDPWVLLAEITIRGDVIGDDDIDNVTYRRHVVSFAGDYLLCGPKLLSLAVKPDVVAAGDPAEGEVTIDRSAPPGDLYIQIGVSDPTSAIVDDHVIVPAGQTSAPFPIKTIATGRGGVVSISATLPGDARSAPLRITTLLGLEIDPPFAQVNAPNIVGKAILSAPAPRALTVNLSVDNAAVASPPASITIPAGAESLGFPVAVKGPGLATFTAELNGARRTAQLSVYALTGVSLPPKAIAGQQLSGAVEFAGTTPAGGIVVSLESTNDATTNPIPNNPNVVDAPATARSTGGPNASAPFTATANRGGTATVTALDAFGPRRVAAKVQVIGIKDLSLGVPNGPVASVETGSRVTGRVVLTDAVPAGMRATVTLTTKPGHVDMPASATIGAGQSATTFVLTARKATPAGSPLMILANLGPIESRGQPLLITDPVIIR